MRLIIFAFLSILTKSASAQSDKSLVLELKVSKQYQNMLGNTVYNDSHSSWDGMLFYTGFRYDDVWSFGFRFHNCRAKVIDSSRIYSSTTNLKNYGIEISRHFYFHDRVSVAPFINFGIIKGKNQGKFDGTQVGLGGNVHLYFWRGLYVFTGAEYDYHWFDIKGPKNIQNLYNHASALQASVGMGVRF